MPPPLRLSAHMNHLLHRAHPTIVQDPARRQRQVRADTGAALARAARLLQQPRVWVPYRARRRADKEREHWRRGFAIWKDASAGVGDENDDDDDPDIGDDGGDDPDNGGDNDNNDDDESADEAASGHGHGTESFPPPNMLAPWYAPRPAASPPEDGGFADPASGDSWRRLGSNATYRRNDADVRLCHRTLQRLRRRYRICAEDESLQRRSRDAPARLHPSDVHRVCRALEHGRHHRDIFAHDPIWAAWREAPDDGFDPDPDMPRVLAALAVQRRRVNHLHATLCVFARAMAQRMAEAVHSPTSDGQVRSGDPYSRQYGGLTQTHQRLLRSRRMWRKPLGLATSKETTQW